MGGVAAEVLGANDGKLNNMCSNRSATDLFRFQRYEEAACVFFLRDGLLMRFWFA